MKEFYSSEKWLKLNEIAFLLHKAVNKSLDLTIQNIGKEKFEKALKEHRYLMSLIQNECKDRAVFPCSRDGVMQHKKAYKNCYWKDSGCGYPCINEVYDKVAKNNTQYEKVRKYNYGSLEGGEKNK